MHDDVIDAIAGVEKQSRHVGHALGVVSGKQEECQPYSLLGADVEDLKSFERRDNQRVGLGTGVDDVNRRGVLQHPAEQGEQGGLALLSVAKLVGTDGIGVPAGKGIMTAVEVGPVPGNAAN